MVDGSMDTVLEKILKYSEVGDVEALTSLLASQAEAAENALSGLVFAHATASDDDSTSDSNPFLVTCRRGHASCLKYLLSFSPSFSFDCVKSCLYVACREGSVDCIDILISHVRHSSSEHDDAASKIDSLIQDAEESSKYTPLMMAAEKGHLKCVERLILSGACVNCVSLSTKGRTGMLQVISEFSTSSRVFDFSKKTFFRSHLLGFQ
jgi:ankyrin repeat protein